MASTGITIMTVSELVESLEGKSGSTRIEIPKFQRRLTWSTEQQRRLIDSIHRDYPIGSLLAYKLPGSGGAAEVLQIVDGLQRTNALLEYSRRPFLLAPTDLIDIDSLRGLATDLGANDNIDLLKLFETWLRDEGKPTANSAQKLLKHLSSDEKFDGSVFSSAQQIVDNLKAATNIDSYKFPVVIYSGDVGQLPEIFELVNQEGTRLTKYQIFAATWLNDGTQVANEDIRTAINEKYLDLVEAGFNVEDFEAQTVRDHNLFEYLFGLGKVLSKRFPSLYAAKSSSSEAESWGFSLATVSSGLPLSKMGQLVGHVPRSSDDLIDLGIFESAVLDASEAIVGALAPRLDLTLNSKTGSILHAHSELQMVSLVTRLVVARWRASAEGWAEREGWKADWEAIVKSVPSWYLFDIVSSTWRGPTYSILDDRVWSRRDDGSARPSAAYLAPVGRERMRQALDTWFEAQLDGEQRARSNVRKSEKLFLRYLYAHRVSVFENGAVEFELEHLYPVKRLIDLIGDDERGWPISTVSNLALFTRKTNRESGKKTISEFVNGLEGNDLEEVQSMLDKYLLCDVGDVSISDEPPFAREDFEAFLRTRWTTMRDDALDALNLE